jgi:hypothetical protein
MAHCVGGASTNDVEKQLAVMACSLRLHKKSPSDVSERPPLKQITFFVLRSFDSAQDTQDYTKYPNSVSFLFNAV